MNQIEEARKQEKAWIAAMLEDHRQLREILTTAREFLEQPRPDTGKFGYHRWGTEMSRHLVELHDRLYRHFREEENSGMISDLAVRFPRSAHRVEKLQNEHQVLLADMRRLMNEVMQYSAGIDPEDPRLRKKLGGLLDRVDEHENAETELMQRMLYNDVGVGD